MAASPATSPAALARPRIIIKFDLGDLQETDFGVNYINFEFKAMINGGYIIKATMFDAHFIIFTKLIEKGYFKEARDKPVLITFKIIAGSDSSYPVTATKMQKAILVAFNAHGGSADDATLEFVAIDPPSWYLNISDAVGSVYKGRIDQVIKEVVQDYAADVVLNISKTIDSDSNKWWMMRQDPRTFITSLLDWSSSVTDKKTQWITESDGFNLNIVEQGSMKSVQKGFYRYLDENASNTIMGWEFAANNSMSVIEAQMVTQGLSVISGQYLDTVSSKNVLINDNNTPNKQIAKIDADRGFSKPSLEFDPSRGVGRTAIASIPEIYSAGDLGVRYEDYIDGRPRNLWLSLINSLMRIKLRVIGHGIWSGGTGLGADTIFIRWTSSTANNNPKYWWMTGNWIVYGFHHIVSRSAATWHTDLYCARADWNSNAKKIGD